MRHADAGYADAIACAREHGLDLPMLEAEPPAPGRP
jgi:urocanate hydratase